MIRAQAFDVSSTRFLCGGVQRMPSTRPRWERDPDPADSFRVKSARGTQSVAQLCFSRTVGVPIPNQAIDPPALGRNAQRFTAPLASAGGAVARSSPSHVRRSQHRRARATHTAGAHLAAPSPNLDELRRDVGPSAPYRATGATGHRLRPGVGGQPRPAAGLSVMGRAIGTADAQPQGTNVR